MRKSCGFLVAVGLLTVLGGGNAFGLSFIDEDITPDVIFGSGNDNGSWTGDRSNGIELGLRGKLRYPAENTFNSNGDGTYSFDPGTPAGAPAGNGEWSFEWSINTNYAGVELGYVLDDLVYQIRIDYDPGVGTNYVTFDLINDGTWWDHAIGDNSTGNGDGIVAANDTEYASYISTNNVAQNSWRMTFFDDSEDPLFEPDVDGTYDFELIAYDPDDTVNPLASTSMQIIVGAGAPVPEPASLALLGIGIAGLAGARLRKRRS